MPGMDGIQFLVEVRTRFGPTPFILFTGRGREEVVIQAINSGVDFYLQKGGEPGAQFAELTHKIKSAASSKRADDALRKSENLYQTLSESSPDLIFLIDREGIIQYINLRATQAFMLTPGNLIGKRIDLIFPPDIARQHMDDINIVFTTKEPQFFETLETFPTGARWISTRLVPIIGPDREAIQILGISTDITERKQMEDALRQANKKLSLLSSITRHDITNQLSVLVGHLTILEQKQPDPINTEYFQNVSNTAKRISAMIQFTKEYESIGVNAPVWQDTRTLVDTAAKEAPLGQVVVKNNLSAGAEMFVDPLVVKVFYNLMDNAVRYGGKITTIRFSIEDREDDHVVVCEDDGDGIVAEEKEKIFERGYGKNIGMGLALSREILDITGITIRETGKPEKGARFEMTVPKGAWRMNPEIDDPDRTGT
jgi:PAS domain S-box-containing protein